MNVCEYEWLRQKFEALELILKEKFAALELLTKIQGEKIMAQIDDLNAAIQAEDVEISDVAAVVSKVDTDLAALKAAVDAGATGPDLSAQIQAIQSHTASLTQAMQQLTAADDAAVPPTPPAQ